MTSHAHPRPVQPKPRAAASQRAERARRLRLVGFGAIVGLAAVIGVVLALTSARGTTTVTTSATAVATVNSLLDGIPQSGTTLGRANAPVTVTEFGDLVCPVCAEFAVGPEAALIAAEVRTGQAKLVFRGLETASGAANQSEYVNTQVAVRSAGLQNDAWYYILLAYEEQPQTINGAPAEDTPYVTSGYLQQLAAQIHGLNLTSWQAGMNDQPLINAVSTDAQAATQANVTGTPTIFVSGPKGTVRSPSAVPALADLQAMIRQVS